MEGEESMKKTLATAQPLRKNVVDPKEVTFLKALLHGDLFVKLSTLIMGLGYARRGKYLHAIVMTVVEVLFGWYCIGFGSKYLSKLGTLGTQVAKSYFDLATFKNVWTEGDNSFLILLYSVLSICIIAVFLLLWVQNIKNAYRLQLTAQRDGYIPTLRDDVHSAMEEKYHVTLLALPVLGVVMFTIIPLIVMICVAFTNYDQEHMPPSALFTWVGLTNFKKLLSTELSLNFSYAFWRVLAWTLVWAVLATFTCYIGGILLALLINNKKTRCK